MQNVIKIVDLLGVLAILTLVLANSQAFGVAVGSVGANVTGLYKAVTLQK